MTIGFCPVSLIMPGFCTGLRIEVHDDSLKPRNLGRAGEVQSQGSLSCATFLRNDRDNSHAAKIVAYDYMKT